MAAYRYNGVKLPALPEWDAEAYPFAHIQYIPYRDGSFMAHLRCSSYPFFAISGIVTNPEGASMLVHSFASGSTDFAWGTAYPADGTVLYLDAGSVIWCNADITDEQGEVFLAASEPAETVAVSMPEFDIGSWLNGFILGLAGRPLWALCFEGDLITAEHPSCGSFGVSADGLLLSDAPAAVYRLSVDGVLICKQIPVFTEGGAGETGGTLTLGNLHLLNAHRPDSGEDFGLCTIAAGSGGSSLFLSRVAGTFHVKVEVACL